MMAFLSVINMESPENSDVNKQKKAMKHAFQIGVKSTLKIEYRWLVWYNILKRR